MPFIESESEFLVRHCNDPSGVYDPPVAPLEGRDRYRLLLPTGAAVYHGVEGRTLMEPPDNDYERLSMRRRYWAERHRRAVREFDGIKLGLLGKRAMTFPSGDPETWGRDRMAQLQREAGRCAGMLDRLDGEIARSPEHQAREEAREMAEAMAEAAARRCARELGEVRAMTISPTPAAPEGLGHN